MISTREEFAQAIGVKLQTLTYVLYRKGIDSYYHSFTIPKRNGGVREIDAPTGALKYIQKRISIYLWNIQLESWKNKGIFPNISHAFQRKKSIITNASVHKHKKYVANFDLEDYFSSIHFGRVKGFFEKNHDFMVSPDVATVIAQLTCYKGKLPQGAPSSPVITNLIGGIMDAKLLKLAKKYKMDYTRYADDLTFSSNAKDILKNEELFKLELEYIVKESGFRINPDKTRVMYKDSRQSVTGLVVNKKISIKREYYKQTRAMAYSLYRTGEFSIDGQKANMNRLEGRFAFINQIDKWNNKLAKGKNIELSSRERQYRNYLIYKYFFSPLKPTIIVEGKTDVLYIKSALQNLCNNYPRLITEYDGRYTYHISFLKKTKRLKYFLEINEGGDTFKNIVMLYKDKKDDADYYNMPIKWMKAIGGRKPDMPVIMILDNETSFNSPLKKLLNVVCGGGFKDYSKDDSKRILAELNSKGYKCIIDNLYIVTIPKETSNGDSEIEDLFNKNELKRISIGGKQYTERFEKDDTYDNDRHFSKDAFSKHVYRYRTQIDFNGFIPLLDILDKIISEYNGESVAKLDSSILN